MHDNRQYSVFIANFILIFSGTHDELVYKSAENNAKQQPNLKLKQIEKPFVYIHDKYWEHISQHKSYFEILKRDIKKMTTMGVRCDRNE